MFSHNLSEVVSKSEEGEQICQFVCYVNLKWKRTVLAQAHSNQSCLSLPGQRGGKKSTLLEFYSVSLRLFFLS